MIADMLATWEVAPSSLGIEITESAVMFDAGQTVDVLSRLRAMGIQIAIDDFGAGHAALGYLRYLPIHLLKIDKSFVHDMLANENDSAIVHSTIDLAHSLGLRVVAEGIEDRETWERLGALGCDLAQGFYLCRPLPPAELAHWLRASADGDAQAAEPTRVVEPAVNGDGAHVVNGRKKRRHGSRTAV
jgi:EAL domain-containing protein (putative c-di-GMP-specific phosphodiesterase class I)